MTIFYVNQAYLSHKDNKKIYYCDVFILGQVPPMPNPPEDLKNCLPKENEAKIVRRKRGVVSVQFLGLVETLVYLTVRGDKRECFFDYGYSKDNSKVLYSTHKAKIPNSFSATISNRHRIQYEARTLSDRDFSKIFFFSPSARDRIEDISKYMNSVNLMPISIKPSDFAEDFDPSNLDFDNTDREKNRESVLKVLKKVVDLSNLICRKTLMVCYLLDPIEIKTFCGSVENEYLKISLLVLIN